MRQQLGVDEVEERSGGGLLEGEALPAGAGSTASSAGGAPQSRQRKGAASEGRKLPPTASDSCASRCSRSSRMRRKRIHVNSGTYCMAPAQLPRRMMSQMALTA